MSENDASGDYRDSALWRELKRIEAEQHAAMAPPYVHPCPTCGHCPTCGRGGQWSRPYYPYSPYPTITWTTSTGNAYPSFQMPNPPRTQ